MRGWLHDLIHPASIRHRMQGLIIAFTALAAVVLVTALSLLLRYNSSYQDLLDNVTTASEFNQDFKASIDLKMYYYVIESQYSEGLPLDEVAAAQQLAQGLLSTTTHKESRMAISSVLSLCQNLEEKINQIEQTGSYDERQLQLENNIYVLTALIQEYMYNYLYCEAVQLNAIKSQTSRQLWVECLVITAFTGALAVFFTRRTVQLGRSITSPITDLCARVEGLGSGELTEQEPIQSAEYEIRTLSEGFEQMVGRLNRQIQETTRNQESLRRTELALIQAQISPHFLYNTMDTIGSLRRRRPRRRWRWCPACPPSSATPSAGGRISSPSGRNRSTCAATSRSSRCAIRILCSIPSTSTPPSRTPCSPSSPSSPWWRTPCTTASSSSGGWGISMSPAAERGRISSSRSPTTGRA